MNDAYARRTNHDLLIESDAIKRFCENFYICFHKQCDKMSKDNAQIPMTALLSGILLDLTMVSGGSGSGNNPYSWLFGSKQTTLVATLASIVETMKKEIHDFINHAIPSVVLE